MSKLSGKPDGILGGEEETREELVSIRKGIMKETRLIIAVC